MTKRRLSGALFSLTGLLLVPAPVPADDTTSARADVVLIVDNSTSMRQPGMDPERASLLVAMLLADIVPGELAVVGMLDLNRDGDLLPGRETGEMRPCAEDPSEECAVVEPEGDWDDLVRDAGHGALERPSPGDAAFKKQLDSHLEQNVNNTYASLAFRAALGIFERHGPRHSDVPRFAIWLTDGRPQEPESVYAAIRDLKRVGVTVVVIVFGHGETKIREAGLAVWNVEGPAGTMDAFAKTFRGIVQAPYEIDREVAQDPGFEMRPFVDEAWIVVYGDDTLTGARTRRPDGIALTAELAGDRLAGAGAYRVAFVRNPPPGRWSIEADGGGRPAYAVVQRVAFRARPEKPVQALAGARTRIEAGLWDDFGNLLGTGETPDELRVEALVEGLWVDLHDDGTRGDLRADDGRFSGFVTFPVPGTHTVEVRTRHDPLLDRSTEITVEVGSGFSYSGEPLAFDFGTLKTGEIGCPAQRLPAAPPDPIHFELRSAAPLPPLHDIELRTGGRSIAPGRGEVLLGGGEELELCLSTGPEARSSRAEGHGMELVAAGTEGLPNGFPLLLSWVVEEPGFLESWWRELSYLGILLSLVTLVLGLVLPRRFDRNLAITFVPRREDLDEQPPQLLRDGSGVGSGFFRHARAYLHPNFRLSPRAGGSIACLKAEKVAVRVCPRPGTALSRETLDDEWEAVGKAGRRPRAGEVFRVSADGPYFQLSFRHRST